MFELNASEKKILENFIRENKSKYSNGIQDFFDNSFDVDEIYQNDFMGKYMHICLQKSMRVILEFLYSLLNCYNRSFQIYLKRKY